MRLPPFKNHLQKENVPFYILATTIGLLATAAMGILISKIPLSPNLWVAAGVITTMTIFTGTQLVATLKNRAEDDGLPHPDQA